MNNKNNSFEDKEKLVSILSYFIIGIIWFFLDTNIQNSTLVKFHVKQAIVLIIADLLLSVILDFIYYVPILGLILSYLGYLLMFILVIIGVFNAALSREREIPLVGSYASYLKF